MTDSTLSKLTHALRGMRWLVVTISTVWYIYVLVKGVPAVLRYHYGTCIKYCDTVTDYQNPKSLGTELYFLFKLE